MTAAKDAFYGNPDQRPPRPAFDKQGIPAALIDLPQWVAWRLVWKDDDGRWSKMPVDPHKGCRKAAKTNDPTTWATYAETAAAANEAYKRDPQSVDGLGFVFKADGGLFGLDIDGCRDPQTGELTPLAAQTVAEFATYAEVSPSGMGGKLIGRGSLPGKRAGKKNNKVVLPDGQELELYDRGRYFTITGLRLPDAPREVTDCSTPLAALIARHFGGRVSETDRKSIFTDASGEYRLSDSEIIEKLTRTAKNAAKGAALWRGDTSGHGGDDSAADLALCDLLAFYTGSDSGRIDHLFRQSGLFREKWNREDYRTATIRKALDGRTEFYQPSANGSGRGKGHAGPSGGDDTNDAPDNPHCLAAGFLSDQPGPLRYWRGEFHRYTTGAYLPIPDGDIRGEVTEWVRKEFLRLHQAEMESHRNNGKKQKTLPTVRSVTVAIVGNVLQALRGLCLLPASIEAPAWIDGANGPDPARLLVVQNGLLDLEGGALLPHSPKFFTPSAAPFDYDPSAPRPAEWLKFLAALWKDDRECIGTLQEWFGYQLTPDTRMQKMMFLIGPKRSGKGTIARILRELVGMANVAGPTLGSLAMNFGLAPLLGKSVGIISDARLSGRSDSAVVVERLLSVSGEDTLTVDRKHVDSVTVKLSTRFTILTNELPRLGDASGALAGRLILLPLKRSWYGQEDHRLFERLRGELPGILLWAIEGWCRLRERGRFVQPASGAELLEDMEDLGSPVGAFVRERCVIGERFKVEKAELYREWRSWCEEHGRKEPGNEGSFGRDLRAAAPEVTKCRPRTPEGRLHLYSGIRLRRFGDPEPGSLLGQVGQGGQCDHVLQAHGEEEEGDRESISTMPGHPDHPDQDDHPGTLFPDRRGGIPD